VSNSINTLLSVDEAARLTGLAARSIRHHCTAGNYHGAIKGADGWIIPLNALSEAAQAIYQAAQPPSVITTPPRALPIVPASPPAVLDKHLALRQAPDKSKARAALLCAAVQTFEELRTAGESKGRAAAIVAEKHQVNAITLWRARDTVSGQAPHLWEALLLPNHKGRTKQAEFTGAAWEWIRANYLSTSEPPANVVIKEAKKHNKAAGLGWIFPSDKTIIRKINTIPAPLVALGRKGKTAFDATFPAAERDFSTYELHDTWVSDGRRADVFCRYPDESISRPFIVAWVDMRSRMVLGVRGSVDPSQSLTIAALHSALERTNIKPKRALLDNGREYAGKQVTGGQKTRYRFKVKEGDPIGALTRLGVVVDWARPYRGQEKPIESFWKYVANHLDKLPQFQGAYCGKNTSSKPEDFDLSKAIPLEIYAQKLAEIMEEFNTTHPHRGQGMGGRTAAQQYQQLIDAAPKTEWLSPTAEDMRLMCCKQVMLTLHNKDASLRFKLGEHGEARYWAQALADLPPAARAKKYNVYFNPDDPNIPVLVYDGLRMICAAPRINMVGNKTEAAQHCITKNAYKKTRAAEFKAIKQAAPPALPAPLGKVFPLTSIVITGKPAAPDIAPEAPKLVPLENGQFYDPVTGATIGKARTETPDTAAANDQLEQYQRRAAQLETDRLKRFNTP
jgi:putative transposase